MISPELFLIRALLQSQENYIKYRELLQQEKLDREVLPILLCIDRKSKETFFQESSIENKFVQLQLICPNSETTTNLLDIISKIDFNEELLEQVIQHLHEKQISKEIALEALAVSEGRGSIEKLKTLSDSLKEKAAIEESSEFVEDDLEILHKGTIATPGLRWRLSSLNEMLGSLRRGDFGFLFARPESGKTTFLASEVTHFAGQTDKPILWFNNEEQGSKVALRCYQASLGCTTQELFRDIAKSKQTYLELTGGRIKIYDSASISKSEVTRLCKRYGPALILFDQIDKIKGFDSDRDDLRLGAIYQWAREVAKEYAPVIAITQADGSGEGKRWLTMDNVSGAKTSKQAEADFIIGLGKSHDEGLEYIRHINISKNKLLGDEDTKPELRHGKRDVIIDPQIARFRDI